MGEIHDTVKIVKDDKSASQLSFCTDVLYLDRWFGRVEETEMLNCQWLY